MRVLLLLSLVLTAELSWAASSLSRIDKIKAAYLFNFTKYIEWQQHQDSAIQFCTNAPDTFLDFFRALVKDRAVGVAQREIQAQALSEAAHCDLIFLVEEAILPDQYAQAVIVNNDQDLQETRALFTFFEAQHKLRFTVQQEHIERLPIKVSSELLKLARKAS